MATNRGRHDSFSRQPNKPAIEQVFDVVEPAEEPVVLKEEELAETEEQESQDNG